MTSAKTTHDSASELVEKSAVELRRLIGSKQVSPVEVVRASPPVSVGTGFSVVYTNAQITGLFTNVAYHFRLVVSNAQSVVYGFDQVLDQANVVAWGANYLGQLNVPAGLSNVVAVAGRAAAAARLPSRAT